MTDPPEVATTERDGSSLCLACGLCCRGVLHDHVVLGPDEAAPARALGLPVLPAADPPAFALPCSRLRGTRCTVYPRRPHTCRAYRCRLLERYLGGDTTLEAALRIVRRARTLVASVEGALAGDPAGGTVWQRLSRRRERSPTLPPEALLDAAELDVLCQRELLNEREKRL